jgi:hypothetical protein
MCGLEYGLRFFLKSHCGAAKIAKNHVTVIAVSGCTVIEVLT